MNVRQQLRRWHIWLGWIVGLPLLAWTTSGLVMVAKPIDEVRGADLLTDAPVLPSGLVPAPPAIGPRPVRSLRLEQRSFGPRWIVTYADGESRVADPASGRLLPPLTAADAAREVAARYTGTSPITVVDRTDRAAPPIDLRRPIEAWRVSLADGTRFYVDAATGEIVARRTRWWRFYDWMWGLHIMDLETREDSHNPLVIGFGIVVLLTTIMALIMLPLTLRRRSRKNGDAATMRS
ncbi:PepSY domain-containing protein [Sphingosinicella sp. BN140058]|uniref:PepSY domain-containing protein n=1 Tax=Sphingosinicella sp. BN140058 TaxID=1892855 RepID=UPI0010123CD5|nr:PepSY domain-containing protein [Sphingosinicella sp. BN140058]QAY77663.1 hypothetical protein ETR14_14950 [Sphingosinicella sp. BN140058]